MLLLRIPISLDHYSSMLSQSTRVCRPGTHAAAFGPFTLANLFAKDQRTPERQQLGPHSILGKKPRSTSHSYASSTVA